MTENVVDFPGDWYGDTKPADLLEKAKAWNAERVVVLAYIDGEVTGGSSIAEVAEIVLLIEKFKHKLLSGQFETSAS